MDRDLWTVETVKAGLSRFYRGVTPSTSEHGGSGPPVQSQRGAPSKMTPPGGWGVDSEQVP
jgi:hypothetical protein